MLPSLVFFFDSQKECTVNYENICICISRAIFEGVFRALPVPHSYIDRPACVDKFLNLFTCHVHFFTFRLGCAKKIFFNLSFSVKLPFT